MNKEFHYWVTGLIAEYSGFQPADCRTIAYSSEYTDDNNSEIEVFDGEYDPFPSYVSHVSQTENITQPIDKIMKIYPLFHFIPGDVEATPARKDKKTHPLLTTPNSSYAQKIMQYTLQNAVSKYKAKDKSGLHSVGIAAHCYVDTWAHQNFIGWYDDINGIPNKGWPNIGHFDAEHNPDLVNHTWQDTRLVEENINNNARFIDAADKLYGHFRGFCEQVSLAPRGSWDQLRDYLNAIWSDNSLDINDRIDRYRRHSKTLKDYDDRVWEDGAFTTKRVHDPKTDSMVDRKIWRSDVKKTNTDWYKFQQAVKSHIVDASTILRPTFLEAGIHI